MSRSMYINRKKVRALMKSKQTNCTLMAERMGYSKGYVMYTINQGYMSSILLESVAKDLGVNPEELLEEESA